MAIDNWKIDQREVSEFIWKKLNELKKEKGVTLESISENIWKTYPYITNALNGRVNANTDFFWKIAKYLWMSEKKFDELIKEANKHAFEKKFWPLEPKLDLLDWIENLNTIEDLDFEQKLENIYFSKKGITTPEDIEYAKKMIEMLKRNKTKTQK